MATHPVTLCLTCSSSPSPKPQASFVTACCSRPICKTCLTKNPRLRGYNPCLACLAGVAVVDKSRGRTSKSNGHDIHITVPGPSGQSQDQEDGMFVLGDSDEDDGTGPPAYLEQPDTASTVADDETLVGDAVGGPPAEAEGSAPPRYYIQPGDRLMGIALKYKVDGRKICQLNGLPASTLSVTPHLLHTRTWLILPPTRGPPPPQPDPEVVEARTRERAEKRFQFVTKEVDWRVAKAYVALAEDDEEDAMKSKEGFEPNPGRLALECKAVDRYLEDGEWEAAQSSSGGPRIRGFPPFGERKTLERGLGRPT